MRDCRMFMLVGALLLAGQCSVRSWASEFPREGGEAPEFGILPVSASEYLDGGVTCDGDKLTAGRGRVDPCVDESANAGVYGGFAFVFAKPHMKESFKAFNVDIATYTQHLIGFEQTHELSPRVWLGYQADDGLGLRARYWQYDQEADPLTMMSTATNVVAAQAVTVVFPGTIQSTGANQVLTVGNGLKVQTLDLEGTQLISLGKVNGLVGAGVRYASLDQSYQAAIVGGVPTQLLSTKRTFEGFGPVLSGEFHRPISSSGLGAIASMGGGILFGSKSMERQIVDASNTFPPIISMDGIDEVTGVGELQVGLEWSRCSRWGEWFVRGSYEAQLWTDAGAPTLTFLGFEGLVFSLGLAR